MKRILIIAGDPSGDIIAGKLADSLKKLKPEIKIAGIGGENLEKVSDEFLCNIVHQHALGFYISPRQINFFRTILNKTIKNDLAQHPETIVVPVDFYGFNSCVAKLAKKMGHSVYYYASPQFWASRSWRADRLRNVVDLFLCLYPFEVSFYQKKNLPARFVGHPILDSIPQRDPNDSPARIESLIGLLPGSRPGEIKRHLPIMIRACGLIHKKFPGTRFVLFTVPNVSRHLYQEILGSQPVDDILVEMVQDSDYKWRSQLDLALTASGMESLENALLGIPMVVMYKTNWLTYWIARMLIQIPFLGMPNLLAGKLIVPEFIQTKAQPKAIANPIIHWLQNPGTRLQLRDELLKLRDQFGGKGASDRAAKAILEKYA